MLIQLIKTWSINYVPLFGNGGLKPLVFLVAEDLWPVRKGWITYVIDYNLFIRVLINISLDRLHSWLIWTHTIPGCYRPSNSFTSKPRKSSRIYLRFQALANQWFGYINCRTYYLHRFASWRKLYTLTHYSKVL